MAGKQNQIGAKYSYGNIWMNTGNWTGVSFSITTSYAELTSLGTNFTLSSPSKDFAMTTDGRLKYTGIRGKDFIVSGYVAQNNTGSIAVAAYKNGSIITGADSYESSNQTISVLSPPVSLATNDYVSLFAKRSANTSITIYQVMLSIASVLGR